MRLMSGYTNSSSKSPLPEVSANYADDVNSISTDSSAQIDDLSKVKVRSDVSSSAFVRVSEHEVRQLF